MISANQKPHSKSFRRVVLIARIAARCPPSGDLDQGTNCRGSFPGAFEALFFCLLVFGKEEQIVCFCVECPSATRTWQWTFHLNHRKYPALFTARLEVLTGEEGVRCWVKIAAATSSLPRSRTATVPNTSTQENHSHEMKWLL